MKLTPDLKEKVFLLILDKGLLAVLVLVIAWVLNSLIERLKANMAFVLEVNKGSFGHITVIVTSVRDADLAVLSLVKEAQNARGRGNVTKDYNKDIGQLLGIATQALDRAQRELLTQAVWLSAVSFWRVQRRLQKLNGCVDAVRQERPYLWSYRQWLIGNRPISVRSLL